MEDKRKGLFITMEGPDGAGKSTQLNILKDYFIKKGYTATFTREPGGTDISEKIRQVILDKENSKMADMTETLLYAAARAQLVAEVIKPALDNNEIVVCDRFVDSSIAYQGYGRQLGDCVSKINAYATLGIEPDITLLMKLDSKKGLKRIEKTNSPKDRIEEAGLSFHERVLNGYYKLEEDFPKRIVGIEADRSIDEISNEILMHINNALENKYELK